MLDNCTRKRRSKPIGQLIQLSVDSNEMPGFPNKPLAVSIAFLNIEQCTAEQVAFL